MVNSKKELVKTLNSILPTYYELITNENITMPCISYLQVGDTATADGDTIRISRITYQIRLYGSSLNELEPYAKDLDTSMTELGYKRVSYNELIVNGAIQMIFRYEGIGFEED